MHSEHENESEKELNSDLHAYHLTILLEIQEEVRAKMEEILCADLVDPVEANFQMVTLQICSNEFQDFWQRGDTEVTETWHRVRFCCLHPNRTLLHSVNLTFYVCLTE